MSRPGREFLHTPGPTHIPDRVLNAMNRQAMDLIDPRLIDMTFACFDDLKRVFRTDGTVFLYAANGHGGWEAALSNLFQPGDAVLLPETGTFAMAWGEHARTLQLDVRFLPGDWRRAVEPAALEEALRADTAHGIKGVLAVQTDTATGVTSDIEAYRKAIDAAGHPALLVVDTIASLAAAPFEMDAWGVDAAIGASQKALMSPPGLSFVAAGPRALERAQKNERPRVYWDWGLRSQKEFYRRFCGTPPEHLIFALREALDMVAEQGMEAILARHAHLAGAVHRAVETWAGEDALCFNAVVPEQRSVSVTTVRVAEGIDAEEIRTYARERLGVALGGGLGKLEGQAFRIGHMGDVNAPMLLGCLGAIETALIAMGIPHGSGGLRAAVEHLAASGTETGSGIAARSEEAADVAGR